MNVSRRLAVVLASAGLVLGACGDDSTSDSGDTTAADMAPETAATTVEEAPGTTATVTATTEAATGDTEPAGDGPATGEPVKVMAIMDESDALNISYNGARAGLEARIAQINGNGGLGGSGRPIEIEYCVTQLDPNQAADCARAAADDERYVATVGSVLGNGDASNPVLEEAGLANLAAVALAASDGTSTISFPIISGQIGSVGGMAAALYDMGFTNIGLLYPDTPGGDLSIGLVNGVLASRGTELVAAVQIPTANPDLSPQATAVSDGADGVILATDPTTAPRLVQTFAQAGIDVQLSGSAGQGWTLEVLSDLGAAAEGLLITSWFATDDVDVPGVREYLAGMDAAGSIERSDDLAKNGWLAIELLDTLAASVGTIDRASILDAAGKLSDFDTGGLTPVIDFTTPGTFFGGALPRFVNTTVFYAQVIDGKIVATDGEFHDPFVPA